jgi:hypothetical protein
MTLPRVGGGGFFAAAASASAMKIPSRSARQRSDFIANVILAI